MRGLWREFWVSSLRQNWFLYLVVMAIFSLGIVCGALGANRLQSQQVEQLNAHLDTFLQQAGKMQIDSAQAARRSMYENALLIGAIYLLGLTVVGIPFILTLVFMRGFILGFAVSFLTQNMVWQGLLLAIVSIFPQNLLYLPALFVGAVAALSFNLFSARRRYDLRINLWACMAGYAIIMLAVLSVTLGASLVEAYFSPWLIRITATLIETID